MIGIVRARFVQRAGSILCLLVALVGFGRESGALPRVRAQAGEPGELLTVVSLNVSPRTIKIGDLVQIDAIVKSTSSRPLNERFGFAYGGGTVEVVWLIPNESITVPPEGIVHVSGAVIVTGVQGNLELGVSSTGDIMLLPSVVPMHVVANSSMGLRTVAMWALGAISAGAFLRMCWRRWRRPWLPNPPNAVEPPRPLPPRGAG